jgi:hypothetical protein
MVLANFFLIFVNMTLRDCIFTFYVTMIKNLSVSIVGGFQNLIHVFLLV